MKASIGRIVHVLVDPIGNNGADIAPAIITRAWSDSCVNIRVISDGSPRPDEWRTSVYLYEDEEQARAGVADRTTDGQPRGMFAFWPPRV